MFEGLEVKNGVTGTWVYQSSGLSYNFILFPEPDMMELLGSKIEQGTVEYGVFNKLSDICRQAGLSSDCSVLKGWDE